MDIFYGGGVKLRGWGQVRPNKAALTLPEAAHPRTQVSWDCNDQEGRRTDVDQVERELQPSFQLRPQPGWSNCPISPNFISLNFISPNVPLVQLS